MGMIYQGKPSFSWLKKQNNRKLKKFRCGPWQEMCAQGCFEFRATPDTAQMDQFVKSLLDKIESLGFEAAFGYGPGQTVFSFHVAGAGRSKRHSLPLTESKLQDLLNWLLSQGDVKQAHFEPARDAWWGW